MRMVVKETRFRSSTQCTEQIHSQIKHFAELKMKVNEELKPPHEAKLQLQRGTDILRIFFSSALLRNDFSDFVEFDLIFE